MAYHRTAGAFPATYLETLAQGILNADELGPSPLGQEFVNTRGFSLVFRRSRIGDMCDAYPYLSHFLEKAVFPASNAFYVNPLVLHGTSRVAPHVDCRLIKEKNLRIIPNIVSVLYVSVEENMEGGELCLFSGTEDEFSIQPRTNDLIHFRGDIIHSVSEVRTPADRISVVCEQYNLPEEVISSFPDSCVITRDDATPRISPA